MLQSTMTRKGQVTIPKVIRDRLGLKEGEKVFFMMRGEEVVLKVIKGTILELKGSVRSAGRPEVFRNIRQLVKGTVARRVVSHG